AQRIGELAHTSRIPIVIQSTVAAGASPPIRSLRDSGIPCLEWPEEATAALALRLGPRSVAGHVLKDQRDSHPEKREPWDPLLAAETERVVRALDVYGIPHGIGRIISRRDLSRRRDKRWVLRLDGFVHKTAAGAIKLGVQDRDKLSSY